MRLFNTSLLRKSISLNGQWFISFDPKDEGMAGGWAKKVRRDAIPTQVPWSWNCHLSKYHYTSVSWYYRKFHVDSTSSVRFIFGAVSGQAVVFLDGEKIGEHYGSFTGFAISAPEVIKGWHILSLRIDAATNEVDTLPQDRADWFNYGGILGPVDMEFIDKISIEHIKVTYDWTNGKAKNVAVEFKVMNWSDKKINAPAIVYLNQDKVGAVSLSLLPHQSLHTDVEIKGLNFKNWHLKEPYLYTVRVVCGNDDLIEQVGFRNIRTRDRDILLNDEPIFLKGINRHNIHPDFGFAVPPQIILRDMEIIKSLGCNCIRGSHYPNDPLVLDYCDQMGLLFWEELPLWGMPKSSLSNMKLQKRALNMLEEMIIRDINHPSIICWGIQNESASDSKEGKGLFSKMASLSRKLDHSRLIVSVSNKPFKDISYDLSDLVAINSYHGWYNGSLEDWESFLEKFKTWLKKIGQDKKPLVISEFGTGTIFGEKRLEEDVKWTEQYQKKYLQTVIKKFLTRREIGGMFIWQYCDIPTSPHLYISRPRECNNKGIVNEYRLPKEAFWTVRELYSAIESDRNATR